MKNILYIFVIILLNLGIFLNYSYADSGNETTVKYLIKYSDKKIYNLEKIIQKYDLGNDKIIKGYLTEIKNIKDSLNQSLKYKTHKYIDKIIDKLKNNNDKLKKYLKEAIYNKKYEAQRYSLYYSKKIKPIINKIQSIIKIIGKEFGKNIKTNKKNKQIIDILIQIQYKLNNLEKINKIQFNTKEDLKKYLIDNFKQIQFNFRQIKNIIKSS